jgi:hypothetical protein
MNPRIRSSLVLGSLAALLAAVAFAPVPAPARGAEQPQQKKLRDFMRQKLTASSQVLEGLAVEDHELIKEGADALYKMSAAELFNVLLDDDYREFNREFRSSIRKLREAADDKNIDDAALQWIDAVKSCVECHKYVRARRGAKE